MSPPGITEALAVRKISDFEFETVHNPDPIGDFVDRVYGGITTAVSLNAAYNTVPKGFHIYSFQGNFLGPGLIDRPFKISVRDVRSTRTFATRLIETSQILDNGKTRVCLVSTADFMTQDPPNGLEYSQKPSRDWGSPKDAKTIEEIAAEYIREGKVPDHSVEFSERASRFSNRHFETRFSKEAVVGQLLWGLAKHLPSSQDHLSIAERLSADFIRCKAHLNSEIEHAVAFTCFADMMSSFIAAIHNKQQLMDYSITSSLDFSVRFFTNKLNVNDYLLREMSARIGAEGRSFHEMRFWDKDEKLVACMTQQAILRPLKAKV